jgi:hypothetical protein
VEKRCRVIKLYVTCIVSKLLRGGSFQVGGVVWKEGQSGRRDSCAAQYKRGRLAGGCRIQKQTGRDDHEDGRSIRWESDLLKEMGEEVVELEWKLVMEETIIRTNYFKADVRVSARTTHSVKAWRVIALGIVGQSVV